MTANEEFEAAAGLDSWDSHPVYEGLKSSPQSYFELRGTKNGRKFIFGKYDTEFHAREASLRFWCQIPRSEEGAWQTEIIEIPF